MKFPTPRFACALLVGAALVSVSPAFGQKRAMELEDMFRLKRVSDPQLSPDGKRVAYVVTDVLKDENRTNADIWLINADGSGAPRKLTNSPKRDAHPRWSPDGKWIAFESTRDGDSQIYLQPAEGGEARKLTTISTGASQAVWAPDGKSLAFVSAVFAEFSDKPFKESDKLNQEKQDARDKSKVKARTFDKLLYRHWDSWVEDKRQHLFVIGVNADGTAAGDPRDVTPGENDGVPTADTFSAGDDFAFSPDGKEIAFTAPPLPVREQSWSTNYDIWTVNLSTGAKKNITEANKAADGCPRYSPDGKFIAYHAQSKPGFESDRWRLYVLDRATGERRALADDIDAWIENIVWSPDQKQLYVEAEDKGSKLIWSVPVAGGASKKVTTAGSGSDVAVTPDGGAIVLSQARMTHPMEVYRLELGSAESRALTHSNDELLAKIAMNAPESVTVKGAGGTPVQMWIVKPPGFDASKKYPLVFWVHGGPQGAFLDTWSTRWNPEIWAAQGYVIAMPNPRGSTGFGQKFTDEISRDWAGKVYDDVMAGLAYMEAQPYVDTTRMAAAGASYGGYMMAWLEGHTDKFKCIVDHDGVYNFDAMYGTTDELWFEEWEHGKPWETTDQSKFSPNKYVANFKTPMLVIQNDMDFRVPIQEGISLFTALQRKGIPSKLLMFPDEGHWVLKPGNSELWHKTIFAWLADYLKK